MLYLEGKERRRYLYTRTTTSPTPTKTTTRARVSGVATHAKGLKSGAKVAAGG
jgi:hypothetical protein